MRRAQTAIAAMFLATALAVPTCPAMDLARLPSDTQWLLHVDVATVLADGELGRLAHEVAARPDVQPKLAALTAITSFDLLHDLVGVTLAGSAAGDQAAVLYVDGRFDRDRLVTLVKAADGYAATPRGTLTIHRWRDQDKPGKPYVYASFLADDVLAIGSGEGAVDHAVDGWTGATRFAAPTAPATPGLVAWGHANDLARLNSDPGQAAMLKNVQEATLSLVERDGALVGDLALTAADAATAEQLQKLATGLQALALLGGQANQDPVAGQLLTSLRITAADRVVHVATSCPVASLRSHPALALQPPAVPER